MATRPPRVFTIPSSAPFVRTLIAALRDGTLVEGFTDTGDPLALASATIYLPTRRACRLARDVFLDVTGVDAAILPRIVPIGDIDEDELVFADAANASALDLKDELGGLERRLLLTQLVTKWAASQAVRREGNAPLVANNPASALALADALARLMDDMTTRQVPWDKLDTLVPGEHDEYWQLTLRFLNEIVREAWPLILDERGKIEPAERRDLLIAAEAKRLAAHTGGPVIAAGSTGSMPATAALIETIAKLPHGAVVLPGLDTDLDEESWDDIAGRRDADGRETLAPAIGHPQFAMQALLRRIGITRAEVLHLGEPAAHGREAVVSEVMRPADKTDKWRDLAQGGLRLDDALKHVSVIAAANAEEEALAIAVALRETLEDDNKTAALVTPDRALARRVLSALARWDIPVDDSGGDALADTPAGVFARLVAEAALKGLEPVTLLALLKHPLLRLGASAGAHAHGISVIEQAVLRGPRPKPGTAGLAHALKTLRDNFSKLHRADPRARLSPGQLQGAADLVAAFDAALKPLEALAKAKQPLTAFAGAHRQVIEALSKGRQGDGVAFTGADGTALDKAFLDIADNAQDAVAISAPDYPDLFRAIVAEKSVRRPDRPGVRVRIYGLLEARLQSIDRVVLGGLVESVWPPETRSDPWLSRPMRHSLGLDLPERRISLSAHDFTQMLGAGEVVLAYPAKLSGAPTVPSRFIQRLAAVAGDERWAAALARGESYLGWARELDRPARDAAAGAASRTEARARRAADLALRHRDRDLAARPLFDLCAAHSAAAAARRHRHAARRARPRHRHPRRHRHVHDKFQRCAAQRRRRRADQARRNRIRRARGFPRGARLLVATVPPHRALVCRFRSPAPRQCRRDQCGDRRQAGDSAWSPHLHAAHARRPHRASARRKLRDPRLQDRPAAHRAAGVVRADAAAHARGRDPARRPVRRDPGGRIDRRIPLRDAARRRSRRRTEADRFRRQHARRQVG